MKKKYSTLALAILLGSVMAGLLVGCKRNVVEPTSANRTTIWLHLSAKMAHPEPANYVLKDNMELQYLPVKNVNTAAKWQSVFAYAPNGYIKWTLYINEPVKVNYGFGFLPLVNPGDSIIVSYSGEKYKFSGKGAGKLTCWNNMRVAGNSLETPTFSNNVVKSLNDYLQWSKYVDDKLSIQMPILESYKSKITAFDYDYLKTMTVSIAESDRIQTFKTLQSGSRKDSSFNIKLSDLSAVWDSTQNRPLNNWMHSCLDYFVDIRVISDYNSSEVSRKYGFDTNRDSLKLKGLRNYLFYTNAKQKYKGLLRERLLADIMEAQTKKGYKDLITQLMLKDYYSQPGFPEYKKQVKELEEKVAQKLAKK